MNGHKPSPDMDTTLRCSVETRDKIAGLGGKDDRFEDILQLLVKEHYELLELKKSKKQ